MVFQSLFTSILPNIYSLSIILCHLYSSSHPFYTLDCHSMVCAALTTSWPSLCTRCTCLTPLLHSSCNLVWSTPGSLSLPGCHIQISKASLPSDASRPFSAALLRSSPHYHPSAGNISQHYSSHFKDKMSNEVGFITVVFIFEYSVVAHWIIVDFALLMKILL